MLFKQKHESLWAIINKIYILAINDLEDLLKYRQNILNSISLS